MIKEIRAALKTRKLSVYEIIKECEGKARSFGEYNIYTEEYYAEALGKAEYLQSLIAGGDAPSLCGIPLAIKDNIAESGRSLTCGSKMLKNFISPYSATCVEKLQNAGALLVGKTNMDEFGMGSHSQNSCFGGVKNPINREYSPGGSSGGSAAAVKCGAAIGALGSDTGGSVRLPAAYCGVCGLRPTYGAISRYGLVSFCSSLDTVGIIGNTPADCYEIFSSICGADPRDSTSEYNNKPYNPKNYRLCSLVDCFSEETDGEVRRVIKGFLDSVEGGLGGLDEVNLKDMEFVVSAYYLLSSSEAASNLLRFDGIKYGLGVDSWDYTQAVSLSRSEGFGDEVKKRILLGNYALSSDGYEEYYKSALNFRHNLKAKIEELLQNYDAILLPTSLIAVPKLYDTESISKNYNNDKCNAIASLCGLPALSLPVGKDKNGMPVSISIIGRKFGEKYISELAEKMLGEVEAYV